MENVSQTVDLLKIVVVLVTITTITMYRVQESTLLLTSVE